MPLGKAMLIFHQGNIGAPRHQRVHPKPFIPRPLHNNYHNSIEQNNEYVVKSRQNDMEALRNRTYLPPVKGAIVDWSNYSHSDRIPDEHTLNTNNKLQRAMEERKEKCVRARNYAVGRRGPQRKGLLPRELFNCQLKYRHIQSQIKKASYIQWVNDHAWYHLLDQPPKNSWVLMRKEDKS